MKRNTILTISLAAAAFAAGCISTLGQAAERFDHQVREGFFAGFNGDRAALERSMKICEQILAVSPNHPEAMVWHGGGLLFLSGEAFRSGDMQKGMSLFERGTKQMDEAVALQPDSVAVRIPRGATYLASSRFMPPQMGRPLLEKGLEDYSRTEELQKSVFGTLGTHPRGELLFGLAEGYHRLGNEGQARAYFQRILAELKDTAYARRAQTWMEKKTLTAAETRCIGCHTR